ncbi:MAG TPA: ABC transporter ATP-binding protein [Gammaproteobacteria bacterium]|nr:ABC transporter ATP-binding protein [Gammaproteobacteria bacterium]
MQTKVSVATTSRYVLNILKSFKASIAVMLCVAVYGGLSLSVMPYMIRIIINRVSEPSTGDLVALIALPAGIYLLTQVFLSLGYRTYDYFVTIRMIPALRAKITNEAMYTLLNQTQNYFQNNLSGNLANKINDLVSSIPEMIQIVIDRFITLSLIILFAVITLGLVNIKFAALMIAWVATFVLCVAFNTRRVTELAIAWSEQGSGIIGRIVDILANFLSVQLFSAKRIEQQQLADACTDAVSKERKLQWRYFWIFMFYGVTALMLTAASLYFLIQGRVAGTVQPGDFALVLLINITIMDQLWMIAKDYAHFSRLLGKLMQALNAILYPTDLTDKPNAGELKVTAGQITYDQVHFNYKGRDEVFRNKSVQIPAGQKVGLVGYSGGGKTTFVNLILRLYDVTAGKILIDQQDIRDVTQESLHAAIAMIPQDPVLFHRSLLDNIRYGKQTASHSDIIDAAKRARADDFIAKLPKGYETFVGERGIKLSGGQRQRVAIARAMLKNAPILILDEATSQLDSVTEGFIQDALWELMQGKTTIVIAHRLSTLLHMDRILVFDQGKIVEDGTHSELLAKRGLYKTLWDAQVGGFLPSTKHGAI